MLTSGIHETEVFPPPPLCLEASETLNAAVAVPISLFLNVDVLQVKHLVAKP